MRRRECPDKTYVRESQAPLAAYDFANRPTRPARSANPSAADSAKSRKFIQRSSPSASICAPIPLQTFSIRWRASAARKLSLIPVHKSRPPSTE
jgi:hypothetical protein